MNKEAMKRWADSTETLQSVPENKMSLEYNGKTVGFTDKELKDAVNTMKQHPVVDDILKEFRPLVLDLSSKIADNVSVTGGKATFTIKCELGYDKERDLIFDISGKTTLNTVPIRKNAAIRDKQLSLF